MSGEFSKQLQMCLRKRIFPGSLAGGGEVKEIVDRSESPYDRKHTEAFFA